MYLISVFFFFFFFNDTATTEIYTLSLHDALPISLLSVAGASPSSSRATAATCPHQAARSFGSRSEEHTSELQSRQYLVCRLLLEKKKKITTDKHKLKQACRTTNSIHSTIADTIR